jgi:hypothetical protein
MSIAGIFGSSALSLLSPSTQTPLQKTKQEFQQLGQDLKSGNLSAAQSDITALQQNVAQQSASASTTATISASQTGSVISQDFAKLSTDLKSGNLTAAQADYTSLVQAFQSQGAQSQVSGHHHHHHAGGSDPNNASFSSSSTTSSGTSSTTASPAQLFTELGQDPVIYLPHNRRIAHCSRTSSNLRRLVPLQTRLRRLPVRRAFRLTRNSARSLVPENQSCSFQSKTDFFYFAKIGAAIPGFFSFTARLSNPRLFRARRYERISATKYGYHEPPKPPLVVAKNRNYTARVSHNFFYNFSPFLLTCHKSRL